MNPRALHVIACRWERTRALRFLMTTATCGFVSVGLTGQAQDRISLAGEEAAQELKRSIAAEESNLSLGPVRLRTEAGVRLGFTDNVFFSDVDRQGDFLVNPEVTLRALWPITDLNTLRLSLGVGYEWYLENTELNSDAPLINPDSELVFNMFVGDFRFRFSERFSYQESLFFSYGIDPVVRYFNLTDVGKFARWDNRPGLGVTWDLNRIVFSVEYVHENFVPITDQFEYLERASEWFVARAGYRIGDQIQTGLETQGSLNNYNQETVLNDNWRLRGGPFIEFNSENKISLRAGGGYEMARYDPVGADSDFEDFYAYARITQETRLFTHALTASRETLLGYNANNLRVNEVRYSISSPVIRHLDLGADFSVDFAEEFGGAYQEDYTFYRTGFTVGWQFHKYWRANLGYEYMLKNSDLPLQDFYRNRVTLQLIFIY